MGHAEWTSATKHRPEREYGSKQQKEKQEKGKEGGKQSELAIFPTFYWDWQSGRDGINGAFQWGHPGMFCFIKLTYF